MTIIDTIVAAYTEIMTVLAAYPIAQGAVATSMGLAVTAGVGFVLWKLPAGIYYKIKAQCFTTLIFNSQGTSEWDSRQAKQFNALLTWLGGSRWVWFSRNFTFNYVDGELVRGPGPGNHFFMRGWRVFFMNISEQAVQGTTTTKYAVVIRMLGRDQGKLNSFMDTFMVKEKNRPDTIPLYNSKSTEWEWVGRITKRPMSTLILAPEVESRLFDPAREFHADPAWYRDRGINYKLTYLLYGEPGTGKSSIARVLASMFDRPVYTLDLDRCVSILSMIQRARGGVLLMEDVDTFDSAVTRLSEKTAIEGKAAKTLTLKDKEGGTVTAKTGEEAPSVESGAGLLDEMRRWGGLSLSSLLNALDGVAGLDDVIVIMTSNHPEKLDPALVRDGRVDLRIEIPRLTDAEIRRYVKLFFPDYQIPENIVFRSLPGATVQKEFMCHKRDAEGFVKALLSANPVTDEFKAS